MSRLNLSRGLVVLAITSIFMTGPAFSKGNKDDDENDEGRGRQGQRYEQKHERKERKQEDNNYNQHGNRRQYQEIRPGTYFNDQQRNVVRQYYTETYGDGRRCPPGLARKNNGCMPPGQARTWAVGQPVPRNVTVYQVPQQVSMQLPPAPVGYRYERIGGDIVLVRMQNNLIVDIIQGLLGG